MTARPAIPEPMKREVRQRCGFGCVICGKPLYHYDHIIDFAEVREHRADNLTLLCPNCHQQKSDRQLSREAVRAANADPINRRVGHSTPLELLRGTRQLVVMLGTNTVAWEDSFVAVRLDDFPVIAVEIEDDHAFLSTQIHDATGQLLLQVTKNEVTIQTVPWDTEFVSQRITVRSERGKLDLRVQFDPMGKVVFERLRLYLRDQDLEVNNDGLWVWDATMAREDGLQTQHSATYRAVGLQFGRPSSDSPAAAFVFAPAAEEN